MCSSAPRPRTKSRLSAEEVAMTYAPHFLCQLHREVTDAATRRVDEHPLPRPLPGLARSGSASSKGREGGGRRCFVGNTFGDERQVGHRCRHKVSKRAALLRKVHHAEDPITYRKGRCLPRRFRRLRRLRPNPV